ncbi:MAG: D-alanyl-D-alanine carboxypeptidase family protein [Micrococcales bacterium]|nr:D-alanyl-D-alanine carboxypeptidase family protein [Micrococcales bacterium]
MNRIESTRERRPRARLALLVILVAVAAVLGFPRLHPPSTSAPAATPELGPPGPWEASLLETDSSGAAPEADRHPDVPGALGERADALTEADGILPAGATVWDDQYPGIANLDPALLAALRDAATEAQPAGITSYVASGWRSPAFQNSLLQQAIALHGSAAEASRWVATPEKSLHVKGQAVDVDGAEIATWLVDQGQRFGLCQVYDNEPWHFELCPEGTTQFGLYADAAHDPRLA